MLILTARDAVQDRIAGLDSGADDYVVKPTDLDELAARLRALVRRSKGEPAPVLQIGQLVLEPAARMVTLDGQAMDLPPREFTLLHLHRGTIRLDTPAANTGLLVTIALPRFAG